jgi:hypothetical protein
MHHANNNYHTTEKMAGVWVVTPCSLVVRYEGFGETPCLYAQGRSYENSGSRLTHIIKLVLLLVGYILGTKLCIM